MTKAVQFDSYGGIDVLEVREVPRPVPGAGEVLVEVGASSFATSMSNMPALVALRRDLYLRVFYQNLVARGKARLQAVVAVMRKLLHALFAMFRSNQLYDGSKLCAVDLAVHAIAACA